jgi:hypothetical protein
MGNRRGERRDLKIPVRGKTKIHKYQNQYISSNTALIEVENISINGLRFSSQLDFPVTRELVLSVEFQLLGNTNQIAGVIVWKRKNKNSYTYGFEILSVKMGYIQSVVPLVEPVYF